MAVKRQLDCENNAERASTNAGGEIDKKTANLLTSKVRSSLLSHIVGLSWPNLLQQRGDSLTFLPLNAQAAVILELSSAVCKLTKAMLNAEPHTEADLNTLFEHRLGRRTGECPLAGR